MEDDVVLAADFANLRNRLDHAYLVVSKHDSDQDGLIVDGPLQVFQVDQAIRLNRQVSDAVAVLFQALTGIEHRFVLGYLGNYVVAALAIHLGNALDGQVIALGRARGKDDFLGGGANQLGYLLTSLLYGLLGFPSKGVVAAGFITELGGEEGNHRIKHTRIHRRGGVVIHVDWQLYVCGGRHCSLNGAHCALSPALNIVVLNVAKSIFVLSCLNSPAWIPPACHGISGRVRAHKGRIPELPSTHPRCSRLPCATAPGWYSYPSSRNHEAQSHKR